MPAVNEGQQIHYPSLTQRHAVRPRRRSDPGSEVLTWRANNSNASEYSAPHLIRLEALSLHAVFPEGQDAVLETHCEGTKVRQRLNTS